MSKLFFVSIFLLMFSQVSLAGNEGRGGEGVVCPAGSGNPPVQFADFEVARSPEWNLNILPIAGSTEFDKAKTLISRLATYDPLRARALLAKFDTLVPGTKEYKKSVREFPGSYEIFLNPNPNPQIQKPKGCDLEFVFIQRPPKTHLEAPISKNMGLYNQLTLDERGALLFHELEMMTDSFFSDNRGTIMDDVTIEYNVMVFTAYVASDRFASDGLQGYVQTLEELHLGLGASFPLAKVNQVAPNQLFDVNGAMFYFQLTGASPNPEQVYSGYLTQRCHIGPQEIDICPIKVQGQSVFIGGPTTFYPTGELHTASVGVLFNSKLRRWVGQTINIQNVPLEFTDFYQDPNYRIELYPNGNIKFGTIYLERPITLTAEDGKPISVPYTEKEQKTLSHSHSGAYRIQLNESGLVIRP